MDDKFVEYPSNVPYSTVESEVLTYWNDHEIFRKSLEQKPGDRVYSFYEGPPTVNGKPGVHHVFSRTIKDVVCRYKTMQGYRVPRKAGWDTGLIWIILT